MTDHGREHENSAARGFFAARWRGLVPLKRVLWIDTILTGTLVNVVASLVALLMLAGDAPLWAALAAHFAPMPYNLFLVASVWRASDAAAPNTRFAARFMAVCWLVATVFV